MLNRALLQIVAALALGCASFSFVACSSDVSGDSADGDLPAQSSSQPRENASRQPTRWLDKTTSPPRLIAPEGVVIEQDLAYLAPDRQEKLDLYYPAQRPKDVVSPAVVIIHGGGWVGGDKARQREYVSGTTLAKAGYVCISVEYMKQAGQCWPTNLHDCKNAVRWLRKNAERLQADPERIGVIGGSAGGHLALMTAYAPSSGELDPGPLYSGVSDQVQACVDMYGVANFLTCRTMDKKGNPTGLRQKIPLFAESRDQAPDKWEFASPVRYVHAASPPTLIIHGKADPTIDCDQANELARKLAEHGVEHELILLEGVGHAFSLDSDSLPCDLRPAVVAFFDKHLKKAGAAQR